MNKYLVRLNTVIVILMTSFLISQSQVYAGGASKRELVGRWLDTPVRATVEIYKQNGKYYLFYQFIKDGSSLTQELELVKEKSNIGKVTFRKIGSETGDHYVITKDNDLELRDNRGFIDVIRQIK